MGDSITKQQFKKEFEGKLARHFGRTAEESTKVQIFKAAALVVRDELAKTLISDRDAMFKESGREVHYLSMEFLIGRSLRNNAYNLGLFDIMQEVLSDYSICLSDVLEAEPDAALGNGGLGRLAACYFDAIANLHVGARGYSIRYENGVFKQRIVDGQQLELLDGWLDVGDVWTIPRIDDQQTVQFGGKVTETYENGQFKYTTEDAFLVQAIPYDMPVAAQDGSFVTSIRLWDAKSPDGLDMNLFSRGEYLKAVEQQSMAEVISKVLYPEDNHFEGKSLRLKQQYFLVSATVQSIVKKHKERYGTVLNFHEKNVVHINDTHPALVSPELMRVLMDDEGLSWDTAWNIVRSSVAYTNHTVMPEALERWPQNLVQSFLPRIWQILCEINERFCALLWEVFPGEFETISKMAIVADGEVRMANLCLASCFSVNGVSALHSEILKNALFHNFYKIEPLKFTNVTNGISHGRWLCQVNPGLVSLLKSSIGDGFVQDASKLKALEQYKDDAGFLDELRRVKRGNKERLAALIAAENNIAVDVDSLFDVQIKRLHEYKRQLLNVLHILDLYFQLKDRPDANMLPRTFIFAAKASPGYFTAKLIIRLIHSVAKLVNSDPVASQYIKVVFLQDYRVSLAEVIVPAAEISEQISIAGMEASGTGNMKLMINGAVTLGTMDGANVEIFESVGRENIFIFGFSSKEVDDLDRERSYDPLWYYNNVGGLSRILDRIRTGFSDGVDYSPLIQSLITGNFSDHYKVLGDFAAYKSAQAEVASVYQSEPDRFMRMSLMNIANSGVFSADRAIGEYAKRIWNVPFKG